MESTGSFEMEKSELSIVGLSSKGKVTYNLVENEGSFCETGIACIRRLRKDRNGFISDMYKSQNYLGIKYLFDDKIIYTTKEQLVDNSNVTSFEAIFNLFENDLKIQNLYILDIEENLLIIRTEETGTEFIALDYKDLHSIKKFVDEYDLNCSL